MDNGPGPSVQSITEQTDLDDFLATAELAGTEFAAGKIYLYSCTPAPVIGEGGGGGFFGGTVGVAAILVRCSLYSEASI